MHLQTGRRLHSTPTPPPLHSSSPPQVLPYLLRLAFGEAQLTWRLAAALLLLLASKAAGLAAPWHFKRAVDALSGSSSGAAAALGAAAAALAAFGACRAAAGVAKELQGPCFAPVSQVG